MQTDNYLHEQKDFHDSIQASNERHILPQLIEKDYWIVHYCTDWRNRDLSLLKRWQILSKGYRIIERFTEDIDIGIEPPAELKVLAGKNHRKPAHVESRRRCFDWLVENSQKLEIEKINRGYELCDDPFRGAGVRLIYSVT